jgi:tetratricopeptide (TPR) repeat protein
MSRDTDKNLFIVSSMPRFYQQLFSGIGSYQELGNRIIGQIKAAHAFRQIERVRELSRLLLNTPIREYQVIGQYYLYWCGYRNNEYDIASLETIIDHAQTYKAQALLSRGALEYDHGRNHEALYFFTEALKAHPSGSEYIGISIAIAVAKAADGFHRVALNDLEKLLPIIKHAEPRLYFDFLNSYAVELGEIGRKQEARNISRVVLASPFIHAYPEWQETAQELKEPSRASISVPQIEREPVEVEIKETPHASAEAKPIKPGRVVAFPELKEAPEPKRPDPLNPQELEGMTLADKREFLLAAIRTQLLSESEYDKLIYSLGLMNSGPASEVIDLEDRALLNDIIEVWCNMIEPDQFAAVMSALRDCKDDRRRESIIDDMISFAYQRTPSSKESESEWRRKVERRLPNK